MTKLFSPAEVTFPSFFLIGELAEKTGLNPTAIRFYERQGLIAPTRHGHFRVFSSADAKRLMLIVQLRAMGLPVKIIGRLIRDLPDTSAWQENASVQAVLEAHKQNLARQRHELNQQIGQLESLLVAKSAPAAGTPQSLPA